MDLPTKEHIKYQFCNVYNDLLSDYRNINNVRSESVTSTSGDEITYAPAPEVKNTLPTTASKRRGRPRKSEQEDAFRELKASRSKKKPSSLRSDITANFETKDNKIQVTAVVHRDASQPSEGTAKIETPTSDEIFDSLLDKKPNEFDITCSQESDVFLPVSKKSRKSYPGASVAKVKASDSTKRLSIDTDPEFERLAKKLNKKRGSSTSKSLPPNENSGYPEYHSDLDKFKSSPGWSRVKAVAKDFKDSSRKLLDISSSKSRQSKTSTIPVTPKAGNLSVLNTSTSDSDQSDVRYFDSPDAEKRYQLMKHVVEVTEQNEVSCPSDAILAPDPAFLENLKKSKEEYVKKLCEVVNKRSLKRKREESIDDSPNSIDQKNKREVRLKSAIHGVKQSESPFKTEKPSASAQDALAEKLPNEVEDPYDFKTPTKQLKSSLRGQKPIQNINQNEQLKSPLNTERSPDSLVKSPLRAQKLIQNRNPNEELNSLLNVEKSPKSIQSKSPNNQLKSPKTKKPGQILYQDEPLNSPLNIRKSPDFVQNKTPIKLSKSTSKVQNINQTEQLNLLLEPEKSSDSVKTRNLNKQLISPLKPEKSPDSVKDENRSKLLESSSKAKRSDAVPTKNLSELKSPLKTRNLSSPDNVQFRNQNKQSELPLITMLPPDSAQTKNKTENIGSFVEALELAPINDIQGENQVEQFVAPPNVEKFNCAKNRNKIARSPDPEMNPKSSLTAEKSCDSTHAIRNRTKTVESPDVLSPKKNLRSPLKTDSWVSIRTRNQNKITESADVSVPEKKMEPLLKAEKLNSVRGRNRNKTTELPDVPMPEKNPALLSKVEKSANSIHSKSLNKVDGPTDVLVPKKKPRSSLKIDKSSNSVPSKDQSKLPRTPDAHTPQKNLEPLLTAEKSLYPKRGRNQKKTDLQEVPVTVTKRALEANTEESVVCLGEFDFDQSQPLDGVTQNDKLSTCGKPVGMSSEKDVLLELSNCDVSEAPLSSNHSLRARSISRRKLNTSSQDLNNALTQLISSSGESSVSDKPAFIATIPLNPTQNLCSRCSCALSDFESSQNDGRNNRIEFISTEEEQKECKDKSKPKMHLVDASIQTDDVLVTEIRSSKETYVQTSPSSQALETVPCKDKTDEKIIRMKDEYILQTLKALMVQASHKLTINDLYNLGLEQENEPPRKKLKEITANNSQSLVKFEEDLVRNENLPLQTWSLSANRGITHDNAVHPPPELKTPQNQGVLRKTASDMKYSLVSTPSSSERKLLDDPKFINRSTICSKDITICENEEIPADDSINKDVVPMEIEDFSNAIEALPSKTKVTDDNADEIETSKLDVVRIRDKTNSSSSNDSLVFSSRKSVHRSLNFQHFFTKANGSSTRVENATSQLHFSNEDVVGSRHANDGSKKVTFSFNSKDNSLPHSQIDDLEYSEDIRKSLSVFPECMDTQKPDGDTEGGIVENSDEDSIIQATPKKTPLIESSLTPDMLSSENSQIVKEEETDFHPVPELTSSNSHKFIANGTMENTPRQINNSALKQSNSNIDSQVNEIPSSIVEDYFPKRSEHKNNFHNNISQSNHVENQDVRPSFRPMIPDSAHNFVSSVTNKNRDIEHASGYIIRSPVVQELTKPEKLFISTSGLTNANKSKVQEFCKQFNCVCESNVTDRTTHLVIRAEKNRAMTTLKYILAVSMHKLIVSVDWVAACLNAKNILPEGPYIPLSSTGQPGPLNSLHSRSNASPLFKDFIIHIVPPFANFTGKEFYDILTWCGARIAETYADFTPDDSRVRLVLINSEGAEEKSNFYREVMLRYKAFILSHDWAIESVSNYKIEPFCTYNPLSAVYSFEMVSQFQIPNYIRDLASRYFESEDFDDTMSEMSNLR